MKKYSCVKLLTITFFVVGIIVQVHSQSCVNVNTFESEPLGVLDPYSGFPGYFADYGSPSIVEEGCPVGSAGKGVRIRASVNGSEGDGLGYTLTGGIVPMPTFTTGTTYQIAGKKLYSELSAGTYTDVLMKVRLSNVNNNGLNCGPDCALVAEKILMLSPGMCESWDPPYEFVSPGDFDFMIISIEAFNDAGVDELFIVLDDWCVEPVGDPFCVADLEFFQEECGKVQFTSLAPNAISYQWNVEGPNGLSFTYDEENPCEFYTAGGTYSVSLTIQCENNLSSTSEVYFFTIEENLPPFFENCPEGETIQVMGQLSDGECIAEYVFPEIFAFDDGNPILPICTFDGVAAVSGQVFTRPAGVYDVVCTIVDDCNEPQICFYQVEILCEDIEPCDYTCCEDGPNWPVEGLALGSLPQSVPSGYYPEYGDPQVINDGCEGSQQGIELKGTSLGYGGDAVGIRNNGTPPIPIFEVGNTYCIQFCMKVIGGNIPSAVLNLQATNVGQTDVSCSGSCEVIGTSALVNQSDGWTTQQVIYSPTADYDNFLMINNDSGPLDFPSLIIIDNVCISIAEPIFCKADFTIEDQGCGKVVLTADTCGEVESYLWLWENGFESFESFDTTICQEYPTKGPWSVTLTVTCSDGSTDTVTKTFSTSADTLPPALQCPNDTVIILSPEAECILEYVVGDFDLDDTTATVTCYQSGSPITDPSLPIIVQEGLTEIKYIAQDTCGNIDSCSYTITLSCEPLEDPKYDCPLDILFVMDNSGSISATEYAAMEVSALAEIAAISGVYTNAEFGVVHYSGLCGDKISIEHDFSPAASVTTVSRQFSTVFPGFMDDLNESLEAVINALNGTPDSDILSGSLSPDPLANLYIVIFTDGTPNTSSFPGGCTNSALLPYTNANILKNTLNANISVVHFVPSYADAQCAAIASQGGTWTGTVDANAGDPTNPVGPRQYIPATFGAPTIDLLTILPPCEPCYNCDELDVTYEEINSDSCCYSIDLINGIGPEIVKLEAEVITPDWQFNTSSLNAGIGYKWYPGTTPTGNKICVTGAGDFIPTGTNSDVMEYCFSETNPSPSGPQIVVFRWYSLLNDTLFELQCTDTLTTECVPVFNDPCITVDAVDVDCNVDNAYEYIINLSVTNTSGFNASHITLNGLSPGFQFANCSGGGYTPTISIPISGGLPDGASTTQCVKILAPYPILNPETICFDIGIYSFFDCCHSPEQVCITIDPCCDPCEDISTTSSILALSNTDLCCYTLSVNYECDYEYFSKIKVSSTTPGVTFGYHALGSSNWQMCGSTATELCMEPISGTIPKGNYSGLLDICFDEINDVSQIPQVVQVDYLTIDPATNLDTVACSEELVFECDMVDNQCLEISNRDIVCISDSSKYRYTFTVTNKSSIAFNATDIDVFIFSPSDLYFDPTGGTFQFTSPLGFNQSETITTCIKSTSSFPSTSSDIILGYRLRYNAGDTCCYESVYDTIPLPPCDEVCCADEEEFIGLISQGFQITDLGDCTYQVCANQFDTCHWFGTLGPDWGDGSGTLNAIIQSDPPNNCWTHTYSQPGPHKVTIHVYEGDLPNNDSCWDADLCSTIENSCPQDTGCFTVVDIEMKNIECETSDCYENPFCQSWLVDEIGNLGCFGIATASVKKAMYNGDPVFVVESINLDLTETKIFDCSGILLQECITTVPASSNGCNPDAGIDVGADLVSVVTIWNCGDPLPVYDPLACISSSSTVIDYCIKIQNDFPTSVADTIDLQAIAPPGISISPSSFPVNVPTGGMTTINFTVIGPLFAGDIIKLKGILSGISDVGELFECMDTICLEVPPCPVEDCCTDEDEFNDNVLKGFTVTQLGDCTYQVCANQFDSCHWFNTSGPDWGDGGVSLQVLTQSNPPNNCWTHTYTQSGTFTISIGISELNSDTGEACWSAGLITTVETDCCADDPCDNVSITEEPISTSGNSCCYAFTLENNFCDDYFKGIMVEVNAPNTISQLQAHSGFVISQISSTIAEVRPVYGFMPMGTFTAFTLCNTDYTSNPQLVSVSWLVPGPGGTCEQICESEHELDCDVDPPYYDKCFEVVTDSIHCESNTYCFKIKNISQPTFAINSVHLYDVSGIFGFNPSGRITIPTLSSGSTSDWICVKYIGGNPGDNACFKLSAHNTPANLPPTVCCTDTIETCFIIPECDTEECAVCPAGSVAGSNLIQNGDFETGTGYGGGWYSGYNLKASGLMGANEYSIRTSSSLVNGQWSAIDHTNYASNGNFLALDGPSGNVAYGVTVNVQPNTNYTFCMWVDNLVSTSTSSAPVIRVDIGTTNVVSGQLLPKNPDGWQVITVNYNSGSNNGPIDIKVRDISTTNFNDWAIDDVSFVECDTVVPNCCTNLDTIAFSDYYDANITLSRDACEGCVTVDLDSCDIATVDFGGGPLVIQDNVPVCNVFAGNGNYTFIVHVERLDENGDVCYEQDFPVSILIEECPSSCCTDLDTIAFSDYYDANITLSRDACEGCVTVDLDSCDIATVDFGGGPLVIQDNVPVCNVFAGNGNYTFIVHVERLDENGDMCYEQDFTKSIEIEDCTSSGSCISLIDGELDCTTNNYCFRVVNHTSNPGFSFASIALVNESLGLTFTPDPISLGGDLLPGDTSTVICIAYSGVDFGDEVCFDLVGHQEDLTIGEEPTFCCADTTRYCFIADCPQVDPCCAITMEEMCDYLDSGVEYMTNQCELCLPFEEDSCMVVTVDFGQGDMLESVGGGEMCITYSGSGIYAVDVLVQRYALDGSICIEKDTLFEVEVDCPNPDICDVRELEIFNAMTPNDDGLNDQLVIDGSIICPRDISIYNRWGQLVWSERDYGNDWTGISFNGEKLPNGTYFLVVEIQNADDKEKKRIQTFIDIRN
ncbi:MAG: gliding motility-associated C-terminal domain-containing protein [Saprospiraceae bacterium]|nr:gliding motility-associated C-terminal domain-containing protein [Saprospiraceae bacterium]